jgi:hypothetical protein
MHQLCSKPAGLSTLDIGQEYMCGVRTLVEYVFVMPWGVHTPGHAAGPDVPWKWPC